MDPSGSLLRGGDYSGHLDDAFRQILSANSNRKRENVLSRGETKKLSITGLPIYPHLSNISDTLYENNIVEVIAPTGYGKSLGIPYHLSANGKYKIYVSVPTIAAATQLSDTLGKYLPKDSKIKIGYAAEGEHKYREDTNVVYMTSGSFRKKMLSSFRKNGRCDGFEFADVLIFDEAHSQSIDLIIMQSLYRYYLNTLTPEKDPFPPDLILASATLGDTPFDKSDVGRYEIPMKTHYNVDVIYHSKDYFPGDLQMLDEMSNFVSMYHDREDIKSHFLVFVSGEREAGIVSTKLKNIGSNALILTAYSNLSSSERSGISDPAPPGVRKIIIATNMVETSITIEDLGMVFDGMVEKQASVSQSGGKRLDSVMISKASAEQRKGRTGRTRDGICYRMITQESFDGLQPHREPEIKRIPVHEQILELIDSGLDPLKVLKDSVPNFDINEKVESSLKVLKQLKMLDNNGEITDIGKFGPRFPISVGNSAVLWYAVMINEMPAYPVLVVLSLMDSYGPSYFYYPRKKDDMNATEYKIFKEEHRKTYFNKYEGRDDMETFIYMWDDMIQDLGGWDYLDPKGNNKLKNRKNLARWCKKNSMNERKIYEAVRNVSDCLQIIRKYKTPKGGDVNTDTGSFGPEILMQNLKQIFVEVYDDRILSYRKDRTNGTEYYAPKGKHYVPGGEQKRFFLDTEESINGLGIVPPSEILALLFHQTGRANRITMAISIKEHDDSPQYMRPAERQKIFSLVDPGPDMMSPRGTTENVRETDLSREQKRRLLINYGNIVKRERDVIGYMTEIIYSKPRESLYSIEKVKTNIIALDDFLTGGLYEDIEDVYAGKEISIEGLNLLRVKITEVRKSELIDASEQIVPDLTQDAVTQFIVPIMGIHVNKNIGIPKELEALLKTKENGSFLFHFRDQSPSTKQKSSFSRASERTSTLLDLLESYKRDNHINEIRLDSYLDIGCGTGEITSEIQRELNIKNSYAADVDPFCYREPRKSSILRSQFVRVEDDNIDIADDIIDLVTSFVAIHHFSNYDKMIREIVRVMKIGGLLFIREHDATPEKQPFLDLIHSVDEASRKNYNNNFIENYCSSFYGKDDLIQSLESYGFEFIGEKTYEKIIPNPQRLYHALLRLRSKNTEEIIVPSKVGIEGYTVLSENLLSYVKNTSDLRAFTNTLKKKLKTNTSPGKVDDLISSSENDRIFFEKIQELM